MHLKLVRHKWFYQMWLLGFYLFDNRALQFNTLEFINYILFLFVNIFYFIKKHL